MPAINVPDDLYQYLAEVAARRGMTVDAHVTSLLGPVPRIPPREERDAAFARAVDRAEARAREGRYPPGFLLDTSREAMYPEDDE